MKLCPLPSPDFSLGVLLKLVSPNFCLIRFGRPRFARCSHEVAGEGIGNIFLISIQARLQSILAGAYSYDLVVQNEGINSAFPSFRFGVSISYLQAILNPTESCD